MKMSYHTHIMRHLLDQVYTKLIFSKTDDFRNSYASTFNPYFATEAALVCASKI